MGIGLIESHELGKDQVIIKILIRNRYQIIRISFSEIEQRKLQDLLETILPHCRG